MTRPETAKATLSRQELEHLWEEHLKGEFETKDVEATLATMVDDAQVNHMPVVYDAKPLSMAWCLECHRHPENFLRPENQIFNLDWKPEDVKPAEFVAKYGKPHGVTEDWSKRKTLSQTEIGQTLKEHWNITPPQNCQGCHR